MASSTYDAPYRVFQLPGGTRAKLQPRGRFSSNTERKYLCYHPSCDYQVGWPDDVQKHMLAKHDIRCDYSQILIKVYQDINGRNLVDFPGQEDAVELYHSGTNGNRQPSRLTASDTTITTTTTNTRPSTSGLGAGQNASVRRRAQVGQPTSQSKPPVAIQAQVTTRSQIVAMSASTNNPSKKAKSAGEQAKADTGTNMATTVTDNQTASAVANLTPSAVAVDNAPASGAPAPAQASEPRILTADELDDINPIDPPKPNQVPWAGIPPAPTDPKYYEQLPSLPRHIQAVYDTLPLEQHREKLHTYHIRTQALRSVPDGMRIWNGYFSGALGFFGVSLEVLVRSIDYANLMHNAYLAGHDRIGRDKNIPRTAGQTADENDNADSQDKATSSDEEVEASGHQKIKLVVKKGSNKDSKKGSKRARTD